MDEEPGGLGRSDEGREFFGRGRADFLHRTEMAQQELYGLRADSFDIFQFTVNETFASLHNMNTIVRCFMSLSL